VTGRFSQRKHFKLKRGYMGAEAMLEIMEALTRCATRLLGGGKCFAVDALGTAWWRKRVLIDSYLDA
jgi:hypothetical protein